MVRLDDGGGAPLSPTITPVNVLRDVLNRVFDEEVALQADTAYVPLDEAGALGQSVGLQWRPVMVPAQSL